MTDQVLPWQVEQWRQLQALQERARLPHGLMLAGPQEIGKRQFVQRFAQALLCNAALADRPCQGCKACQLFRAHTHPDFLAVEPEGEGKIIKVDQIRQVAEFATRTAALGSQRVIVVAPAEAMNINAANALLKTLEEPGAGVVILLVSHQPGSILPTIRSRCRTVSFALPDRELVSAWLAQVEANSQRVTEVMALSGGRPFRARRLLDGDLGTQLAQFQEAMAGLEQRGNSPLDAARVLQGLTSADALEWLQYRVYDRIKTLAAHNRPSQALFRFLDRLTAARRRLLGTANPNAQLLWEEVLMDWKSVIDLQP